MKKTIDEKFCSVIYTGKIEELKSQLTYLVHEWGKEWVLDMSEEIKNLEKINGNNFNNISTMQERIYYGSLKIDYRVNSSNKETQKMIFPSIKKKCENADKSFLEKNPSYSLEIIENNSKL